MYYSEPFSDGFPEKQGLYISIFSVLLAYLLAPHSNILNSPSSFNQIWKIYIIIKEIWALSVYILIG